MGEVEVKEFGKHIVADPRICHGKWTFRGTRIMVWQVLEQIPEDMDWDEIVREWSGKVPKEAIEAAVLLAKDALTTSNDEWRYKALEQLEVAG
jgi:uncharacterized protein (DUF433 family)